MFNCFFGKVQFKGTQVKLQEFFTIFETRLIHLEPVFCKVFQKCRSLIGQYRFKNSEALAGISSHIHWQLTLFFPCSFNYEMQYEFFLQVFIFLKLS